MGKLIVVYMIAALLLGFWPFEDGLLSTSSLSPFQLTYDEGYEDGYDGALPKIRSGSYATGYDDGEFDSECDWLKRENRKPEFERIGCGRW
jgi:hypothetical protein